MDVDENNVIPNTESDLRIITCEVCGKNEAKYTCPRCEVRTCCLECVKIHKNELDCNGLRDKVKFKKLKNFDNIDLLNDYRLLEETARVVSKSVKLPPVSCYSASRGLLPGDLYRLKSTALSRGVHLHFLPPSFIRHKTNTSFLNHEAQELYWKIDWVFPQGGGILFTDDRVLDSSILSACVHKYIEPNVMEHPALSFYQSAGHSGIKLLLKAERVAPKRYHMLDSTSTLRENLYGKSIIEYPVIYVVLNDHIYSFDIFSEEEEQKLHNKSRRRHFQNKKKATFQNNFLFSTSDEKKESKEDISDGIGDDYNNCSQNLSYQNNGRRQNYRRNKRNLSRGRGRRPGQFGRSRNDSSTHCPLSNTLKAVHI